MESLIPYLLTMLAYQLPGLLAAAGALAMLWSWAPPAPGRHPALAGSGLLLGSGLLHTLLDVGQAMVMFRGAGAPLTLFNIANIVLNIAAAVGVVMLAWGASRAMQAAGRPDRQA